MGAVRLAALLAARVAGAFKVVSHDPGHASSLAATLGKRVDRIPRQTMDALPAYDWPGNVRELENVIERALILSLGPALVIDSALVGVASERARTTPAAPLAPASDATATTLAAAEREHILRICQTCGWRIKGPGAAAERLGLTPSTLYFRMKKLGIKPPSTRRWRVPRAENTTPVSSRACPCRGHVG